MPAIRKIHQFFFDFGGGKVLADFPIFVESKNAWSTMEGWEYTLWTESMVETMIGTHCTEFMRTYESFKYPIQRLDLAKYLVGHYAGGLVVDLDVVPYCHVDKIVGDDVPYLFDRCTRKRIVANDFFYVGELGLPGIFDDLVSNKARLDAIEAYKCRKMRYIFHSTGPDFFSRYLKRTKLDKYTVAISDRKFLDQKEAHRSIAAAEPRVQVVHHLSWRRQLANGSAEAPETGD